MELNKIYWLDVSDLWLISVIDLDYIKEIFDIKYSIDSNIMTKPTIKSQI